jgi:hypothetical protein
MVEQAAADRLLFLHSDPHPVYRTVPVRNLEYVIGSFGRTVQQLIVILG